MTDDRVGRLRLAYSTTEKGFESFRYTAMVRRQKPINRSTWKCCPNAESQGCVTGKPLGTTVFAKDMVNTYNSQSAVS